MAEVSIFLEFGENPSTDSLPGKVIQGFGQGESHGISEVAGVTFWKGAHGVCVRVSSVIGGPPQIVDGLKIREVHIFDQGVTLRPPVGTYKRWCAEALVEPYEHDNQKRASWRMRVVGPDWESAVRLHQAIRYSRIRPAEDWERGYVSRWERFWRLVQLVRTKTRSP